MNPALAAIAFLLTIFACALPLPAAAQAYPAKPIVLICPWPPGGGADIQMRALARAASKQLGQNVVIENRPGATGTLGAAVVARAQPDGYLLSQSHNAVLRQPFIAPTPYDAAKDFTYIIAISDFPFGLAVRSDAPWRTLADFLGHARQNPGKVNIAVPGRGSPGHVIADSIAEQQRLTWTVVPYKGTADSLTALMGGHVSAAAESTGWAPLVDSGRARLLAVFTDRRLRKYPEVSTLRELGHGLSDRSPWGIVGPRDLDPAVARTLHDAFRKTLEDAEFIAVLANLAQEPGYMGSEDYRAFALDMIPKQKAFVEKYGLKAN